jgi:2-keto-4-pentenoate hydratase/2-oxohepta-3-ene-1,7-dioic acid hydratase in catechol pathway
MRYARIATPTAIRWALLDGTTARCWSDAPWLGGTATGETLTWSDDMLRAPVTPNKVLCIGRNYAAHARELGNEPPKEPLLFLKPSSSIVGPNGKVVLPKQSERVEHEAELGVVIGKTAKNVSASDALTHVFGYTCVCDVTARDLQKKDGQWSRAKGFDTFCPVGPWVVSGLDPKDLRVSCRVDGQTKQDGRTSQMIFDVPTLIAYCSAAMTLEPGDLLVTGTPEGVGPLVDGDRLEVEIEGIGALVVSVSAG